MDENHKNYMGLVACLTSDPNNQNIIYAGAITGGLWKTTNPTDSYPHWECLTDDYAGMGVTDVLVHPNNSDTLYIVTGIHVNGMMKMTGDYSLGAYKSTDGGLTWNLMMNLSPEDNIYLSKMAFDPNNSSIMYILSTTTVYKSSDGGNNWINTNVPPDNVRFRSIVINPVNTNEIYISGNDGIYKTSNAGNLWSQITTLGHPAESNINIAWHPVENCIYALYQNGSSGVLKKSLDGGFSWGDPINTVSNVRDYVNAFSISPNGNIYAGGIRVYKSENNGNTFGDDLDDMHDDIRDFLFPNGINDNLAYLATDGGVVRNINGGNNDWTSCNGDLSVNQFYDIAISEQDPIILLGGAHDCGTLRRKSDGNWEHVLGGDGGASAIHASNNSIQFATASNRLCRSTNGGSTFSYIDYNFLFFEDYDGPITFKPGNSNIMYTTRHSVGGRSPLLRSTTGGTTGSFDTVDLGWTVIFDIEVNESNTDYIYYSIFDWWNHSLSSLKKSMDGGTNWEIAYEFADSIGPINAIETIPGDPNKVWIAFGGLNSQYKVLFSVDGGSNWINKTYNLDNMPVNSMIYDEANARLLIGNDMGVYYVNDNAQSWERLGSNLPYLIVSDLELNKISGDLFIGTYGRGIWKLHLDEYCYYGHNFSVTGPSEVCASNSTFTLHDRPAGSTVTWTHSSNLVYVSGQGNDNYVVRAVSNEMKSEGWVKATLTQNGNTCDDPVLQKNVWVGRPGLPVTTPDGDPPMEVIYGRSYRVNLFHPPGADPSTGVWSSNGSITITSGTTGRRIVFKVTGWDYGQWIVNTSNTCGVSDNYVGAVYMPMWDFTMYPNPADDYIEIKAEKKEYDTKGIVSDTYEVKILNTLKSPVYQSLKTDQPLLRISTKSFINGIYFVHITAGEQIEVKQLIINH